MSKAAQGFSYEAYILYVEWGNPRRTTLIVKIAIYGWKLIKEPLQFLGQYDWQYPGGSLNP
jgi:hypothetical protein